MKNLEPAKSLPEISSKQEAGLWFSQSCALSTPGSVIMPLEAELEPNEDIQNKGW